jgi:hypothetical protein
MAGGPFRTIPRSAAAQDGHAKPLRRVLAVPVTPPPAVRDRSGPLNAAAELRALYRNARAISDGLGDDKVRVAAIRVAADIILRMAELGTVAPAPTLLTAPEWPQLRQTVLDALAAYPDACERLATALLAEPSTAEPAVP